MPGVRLSVVTSRKTALVSLRAYSRHRGCSLSAVQKAVAAGRITLVSGKVPVKRADAQWAASSANRQDQPLGSPAAGRRTGERRDIATRPPPDDGAVTYANARAEREHYRAKRERMEFERDSGDLRSLKAMKTVWFKLITEAKSRLLSVPSKCKARLPGLSAADVAIIELLIRQALGGLADGKVPNESLANGAEV